jgi:hypothetical protein
MATWRLPWRSLREKKYKSRGNVAAPLGALYVIDQTTKFVAWMKRRGCESIPNFMLLKHVRKNNRLILLNPVSLRDDECGILSQPRSVIQGFEKSPHYAALHAGYSIFLILAKAQRSYSRFLS